MDVSALLLSNAAAFGLVLIRMSGCILFNSIFGRRTIPAIIRAGMIVTFSLVVFAAVGNEIVFIPTSFLQFGVVGVTELAIGFVMGFFVELFTYVIIFGGEIIDVQMGLSMSKVYDPQSNMSVSLSGTYYNILFIFLFFSSGAYLNLILLFMHSYRIIPYLGGSVGSEVSTAMLSAFAQCTIMGVKLALPIMCIELLLEAGVGMLMKAIPQINVFVVNIQGKLLVGLAIMFIMFTPILRFLESLIENLFGSIESIMVLMSNTPPTM